MKMKHYFRKYKYLLKKGISQSLNFCIKRFKAFTFEDDPRYYSPLGVDKLPYPVNWNESFEFERLLVEIGTGHGELMDFLSNANKKDLIVGFEITKTYSIKSQKNIKNRSNAIQYKGDGYGLIQHLFKKESIDKIYILFPDPWHKKKHNKRRPVTKKWLIKVYSNLNKDGEILFVTDWKDYYDHVIDQFHEVDRYYSIKIGEYTPEKLDLVETHYYKKWKEIDRDFYYITATKI